MGKSELAAKRLRLLEALSAERANLFYQMRGLDEALLCRDVDGRDSSFRDRLSLLGYGDALVARNLSAVLAGKRHAVQLDLGSQPLSVTALFQSGPPSLPEALAIALKERHGFLNALNQVPDDLLFRRLSLPNRRRATMATWVRGQARKDGRQAVALSRWRVRALKRVDQNAPASRLILRPLLQASRQELMVLATYVPADERESRPVCGDWTLKDLFGHLTVYEHIGTTMLRHLVNAETPQFERTIRDFDRFNEAQVVARQHVAWQEIADTYRAVRQVNLSLLESLSDEALAKPFVAPWSAPLTGYEYIVGLAVHEREHAAILRKALGLRPLPKRSRLSAS